MEFVSSISTRGDDIEMTERKESYLQTRVRVHQILPHSLSVIRVATFKLEKSRMASGHTGTGSTVTVTGSRGPDE